VETEATRAALERMGCDVVQGFLFTAPLPADALLAWAAGRSPSLNAQPPGPFLRPHVEAAILDAENS
jgi:predicted signal transduction protein with EAL and GGDEF domain